MNFTSLGLIDALVQRLEDLAYQLPTPVQEQTIPSVLAGRDVMVAAQTGTGKTASFALPLLQRLTVEGASVASNCVRCLVLVPTRELAEQVHESFRTYGARLGVRTHVAYGGISINPQMMTLRKGLDVLVATPGRLLDLHRHNAVKFHQLQTLVLDEADRMLDFGFSRELEAIFSVLPKRRQTLLFSATFSEVIRAMAAKILHESVQIDITPRNATATTVRQWIIPVDKKRKTALLMHLLKTQRWEQVLVFAKTREGVEKLVEALLAHDIRADSIHGDKTQPARLRALERFKSAEIQILVATDVAARGLDIEALPHVINFDLPIVAEDYVHRIGRTGRAGATGEAISFVCADEVRQLVAVEVLTQQTLRRVEESGFIPEHRVPMTDHNGQILKKPKKPKKSKMSL